MPTPAKSSRFAPVSAIVSAITVSIMRAMRSTTDSAPSIGVRRLGAHRDLAASVLRHRAGDDVRAAKVDAEDVALSFSRRHVAGEEDGRGDAELRGGLVREPADHEIRAKNEDHYSKALLDARGREPPHESRSGDGASGGNRREPPDQRQSKATWPR